MAAGLLAGVLAVAAPFGDAPLVASGAQQEVLLDCPAGGVMETVSESVVRVLSDGTQETNTLLSIRPEHQVYGWDCYSSDYYYSKLSAREKLLYERLDAACGKLLVSSQLEAASYEITSGGKKTIRRGTKMVSSLGLTSEQIKKVQTLFVYSNPQYYFLNTILLENRKESTCALGIYDEFASGSSRSQATQEVGDRLKELQAQIDNNGIPFETEWQIHELICDELDYMYGGDILNDNSDPYYTQSVYGALMDGQSRCAGYTKLYAMLCNYFGIDCIPVTHIDGENSDNNHAWNQVRYGDQWYIVDVTWDDTKDREKYFHLTDRRMLALDQNNCHVPCSFYDGIRPVADAEFLKEWKTMPGLAQPQVEVRDTAPGVKITMKADQGTVYYTLDGTAPGEDDIYTEPIELTDGGTYIVTAVAAEDGYISSAYEIFPVRIAGGSVSVASATNVTGKKIKVTCKKSKTYTGYEISYASKRDFSNQKSAKVKGKSATISGLTKGKTYYIRVRGYKKDAYGNDYYTPYSKTKKVTVTK